ncbi:MAG: hypothetical protein K2W95_10855 [Candidatus Obscuribacterales bacterium]|nr:hypothetical protein [Candidatus Obscuribacterales bacterium]
MQSDLNKFFPRKRKWGRKSKGSTMGSGRMAASENDASRIVAEKYRVSRVTIFAKQPMLVRDFFVKSVLLTPTSTSCSVTTSRAYREKAGSVRTEPSNIACSIMPHEKMIHLSDIFMTENFGLRLELSEGSFVVSSTATPTDLITIEDSAGRMIPCEVRATLIKNV